jgi:hypothetical protein
MAEESYKATRDLVVAGKAHAEGDTFEADPDAVSVALARGWVQEAKESAPKQTRKRGTKERG